jgi:hypothetical protein
MDPYIEQEDTWHDFHERAIPTIASILGAQLRPRYIVKIDEHVYVHEIAGSARTLLSGAGNVWLPAVDLENLSYVEIRDRRGRELVTVVELLSPANKRPGPDREQYLAKRMEILNGPVHLVEIDLLRGGAALPASGRPTCDYSVLVSRAERRWDAEFWPISLRQSLPTIPVPVRAPQADCQLDLQQVVSRIYDDAGYGDYIHETAPRPKLNRKDAEWARSVIAQAPAPG